MDKLLNWINNNPSGFASLVSAVIAASVSLMVFAVSQFLTRRRERTQFLTPKLEELYLLLNKVSEDNAKFFGLVYLSSQGDKRSIEELASVDDLELYGERTAKKIIMYIRLYFPQLSRIHQLLFAAQSKLNHLIFHLHTNKPSDLEDVVDASGRVGHFIRLMEEEIIRNRNQLLRDGLFRKPYKATTQKEIEAEIPRPDGPVTNLSAD
ncbi:MAG TPA: hypothetical protein VHY30_05540 [Verrucomicrobiae bacterium]|jgi:hypothetical protein|nr:hypothetical protein [Verrucomicrobiae bacterium]